MNRHRLRRPPRVKASGTLMDTDKTISFVTKKKNTDHKSSPRSSPIPKPWREKTWGREGDGFQVRYGQRLARARQVTAIISATFTTWEGLRNKKVKKTRSPSPSPMALPFEERI